MADAVFELVPIALHQHFLPAAVELLAVVGVDPLPPPGVGRLGLLGANAEQVGEAAGPLDVIGERVPIVDDGSDGLGGEAEALVCLPQLGLRRLLVVQISGGADPTDHVAVGVADRQRPGDVPAVFAVVPPDAELDLARLAGGDRLRPGGDGGRPVVGVD